jgi:hypothetical protein
MGEERWDYRLPLFPRRCAISRKWLWLNRHYKLTSVQYEFTEPFGKTRWLHREIGMHIKLLQD